METAVLDRILDPVGRCLTPDVAKALLELRLDSAIQKRLDELADKCTEGALTPVERKEYDTYIAAIDFVTVLQLKARRLFSAA